MIYRSTLIAGVAMLALAGAMSTGAMAAAAATTAATVAPAAGVALRDVVNPKATLAHAKIQDQSGASVGTVSDVLLDASGRPETIKADVGGFLGIGSKLVVMKAANFKFDKTHDILMTNLTKDQIKAMPEAKS